MSGFFSQFTDGENFGAAALPVVFDAERDTPELLRAVASKIPQIYEIMASIRHSLPLAPHSAVGPLGNHGFCRLPNHYRSVACVLPPKHEEDEMHAGAIVFKGTEPLISDFPDYLEWMLDAPFRNSSLPLGLHFPLELMLPPAAMWIKECTREQSTSSKVQREYLGQRGRLARLPLPLFVFRMLPEHLQNYEKVVSSRIPKDAIARIRGKLDDGLGIEVYYYPSLPVRASDLRAKELQQAYDFVFSAEGLEDLFDKWIRLFSDLLELGYMPYVPWNHGMGGCVDAGNACVDGGFCDLLTLGCFETIPNEGLFRSSLFQSMRMLSSSMMTMCSIQTGAMPIGDEVSTRLLLDYVTEQVRMHVTSHSPDSRSVDVRLLRYFAPVTVSGVLQQMNDSHTKRLRVSQFVLAEPEDSSAAIGDTDLAMLRANA